MFGFEIYILLYSLLDRIRITLGKMGRHEDFFRKQKGTQLQRVDVILNTVFIVSNIYIHNDSIEHVFCSQRDIHFKVNRCQ